MKRRQSAIYITLAALLGALCGAVYDWMCWEYHLPYIGLNWLGLLLGADGEQGYDTMLYESVLDFAAAFALICLGIRFLLTKLNIQQEHQ